MIIAGAAFAVVAGVTGRVSYLHIEALSLALHQPPGIARIMPFGVDGLIVVGSVALLQAAKGQERLGWVCIVPGSAASLFANVESGWRYGVLSAAWAGMASVGFFVAMYVMERWLKAQAGERVARTVTVAIGCGHGVAEDRDERIRDLWEHIGGCLGGTPSYRGVGQFLNIHNEIVRQVVTSVAGDGADPAGAVQGPVPSVNGHPHG